MDLKMEEKMKLERSLGEIGIRLRPSPSCKLSSRRKGGGPRWKRIPFHFHRLNPNLTLLLFLALLSLSTRILSVDGNSSHHHHQEVESCVRIMHSGSNPPNSGASAIGHTSSSPSGSISRLGGNSGSSSSASSSSMDFGSEHFLCRIRTLRPDLDMENLTSSASAIPSGNGGGNGGVDVMSITKLKLVCNDVLFFESGVSPGQFSALSGLHELAIEKCKLRHLPADFLSGLRHLRKLTIQTGNSDWAGARSLEISPGAFAQIPALRHLHLGFNHMWSLPENLICHLGSLQTLNLTRNLLSDIDDLGLPGGNGRALALQNEYSTRISTSSSSSSQDGCLSEIKSLDLSYNSLRTLGSRRLEKMRRLQELSLETNWLEELEDDAFTGLSQLKILNLSSNRLVTLPAKLFQPCKLLQELDLKNNSLTALVPGLFAGLEYLQVLDISMNSLSSQWITADAFNSMVRLVILNLAKNELTHLTQATFSDLYSLQMLNLESNLIESIEDGTFSKMANLHSLNLGRNRLANINSNMFNGLYVLHKLIIDYNKISVIESGALKNCTSLQDLGLVGNNLSEVPQALRGLQNLRALDLGENKIKVLNNESFQGLNQLYGLRLVENKIDLIPNGFCDSLPRVRVINLAQNTIHKISPSAFLSCPELRVLRLDSNKLDAIPPTLAPQVPNLLWLNASSNLIRRADYSLLPATLEWVDFSFNSIENLGGAWSNSSVGSPSHWNIRLRVVDISHNQLSELDPRTVPQSVEVFRASFNKIAKISADTFSHSPHIRRVELIGNQLETIPLNALRLLPVPAGKPLPEFFLGGNPLLCGCDMEWLTRINQISSLRQHPMVLDLDAIVCRVPYSRTVTHIPLPDMKPQDFLCEFTTHCFATCECCEWDFCDCQNRCPQSCTCYHDQAWTANIVQCSNSNHKEVPSRISMDATEVYLDGNEIAELKPHIFIGRKNLRVLFLNSSKIEKINNKTFNGLQTLQTLHLESNLLKVLQGYEFDHLSKLKELYLQNNLIETISNTTFLSLKSLEVLRLDGNRLSFFTVWQLSLNPYLVEIGLARNQWNCDCQFLHQLYGWVTDNSKKVIDLGQLQCVWNTTHKPGPHLIDYNRTCGSSWALMGIDGGFDFPYSPLPLIFGCISLVLLLIIIVIAVLLCRDNARLFLFSHFGIRMCASDFSSDEDKLYDAYLLYSQKDEEFVAQRIADELETQDSYRLCLHYRDLISETGDLKEMMVGAVENSKSVVIILSRNFLQGEWASGEYRGAFHAVLKKSQKNSHDTKKVVIVFIDDIPAMDVNPDIRSWVRHNRIQVIKWSIASPDQRKQRKFWSNLKYSLPAPSSHYHSNITSSNTTTATSASSTNESTGGGIMATLKFNNAENELHHQQVIIDEMNRTMTMNLNNKLWGPYANSANSFVALPPPKYGIPNSPGNHSQSSASARQSSHLSLNNYNQTSISSSPLHQSHHHHHYHPPLPLSNPPKSPPSSQSTDSTTTTNGEESLLQNPTSFSLMFQQQQQYSKSPVPVPKSLYSGNNGVLINSNSSSSNSGGLTHTHGGGGESYLSLEGEHVYSTLDPPSPQQAPSYPQTNHHHHRLLNNIHLPNGYTYQPQVTLPLTPQQQQGQQGQWHLGNHHNPSSTPKGTLTYGSTKGYKQTKDGGNNPVQTYLV